MKILVINSGSSSLKYQLFDMTDKSVLVSGLVERIGADVSGLKHKKHPDTDTEQVFVEEKGMPDHKAALERVVELIVDPDKGVIASAEEINAVGHRVLHGGDEFIAPSLIDDKVIATIEKFIPLGPLHNPANLMGIRVAMKMFAVPHVAIFDTAFHQTMPAEAYMYALPYELYEELRIRRYGFHGTSHKYIVREGAKQLGKNPEDVNLITVHLGNGSSMAAVRNGKCVDTTMGLTPLEGLLMGTRSGDIDPAVIYFLHQQKGMSFDEIDTLLNKKSGFLGVCGMSDMRDIHAAIEKGDERCKLALEMFAYRNKKYIGSYLAALGKVDAIIFTAGIGENDDVARAMSLEGLEGLGIVLDLEANGKRFSEAGLISAPESAIQVWVIPTNEELEIAEQTMEVIKAS
ncbi:MAG: acetate kinase [Desulfovibrio sp.]|uniref:acetate kinase n=1 Tax=Desulfovibrio sp. 7SRBS1 TaxID=3378064 RepID=UPI003B3F58AB